MKINSLPITVAIAGLLTAFVPRLAACDLCGCFTPSMEIKPDKPLSYYVSVAEQFTHFGTDRLDGEKVPNPTGQYMNSSFTQVVPGVRLFDSNLSLQVNLPFISRTFKRPEGFGIEHGTEAGFGDMSLLAVYTLFKKESDFHETLGMSAKGVSAVELRGEPEFSTCINVMAGLKLPTGDSSRIKEEFNETEVEGAPPSGIHGHDLALGSGSWDGIFGLQAITRYKWAFFEANVQYAARGQGRHSYRYANDLSWSGGPGFYFVRNGGNSVALQAAISGESKGTDTFQGQSAEDTGVTALYLGPRVLATFGQWSADVGGEWPAIMNTTAFQTTPSFRIRASVSYHF